MEISELYEIFKKHPIVTTDTRNCPPNSVFFALKGEIFNGNKFAQQAIDSGCSYAIVDEAEYATSPNILLVEDSLKVLQKLANHHRKTFKIPVLAITGSNGKTTTKELVMTVLGKEYNVLATEGNYNNHIGVPLTLLRMKKEHDIAIIEMGANHLGEIKALAEIAEPNFGLITNIGRAHLEGFGSYENIIKGKGELYDFIRNTKDGKIFIDSSNPTLMKISEGLGRIEYGLNSKDSLFVTGTVLESSPYLSFEWCMASNCHTVSTHIVGDYNLPNALAAISIGKYFGVKSDLINQAIAEYQPTNNRSQLKKTEKNMLIIDAYNANPTSMRAALNNFSTLKVNHKVVILGDMKELGPDTAEEHQRIADLIASSNEFEKVFLVGEYFSHVKTNYSQFINFEEFKESLQKQPIEDSYVLLKGSRGMQLEKCIELL